MDGDDQQQRNPGDLISAGADLLEKREYDEALKTLDRALALAPEDADALGTKGAVLRMREQYEDADEVLRQALELDPASAWLHAEQGETLRMVGRHREALRALERALDLDPDYAFALGTKGTIMLEQGRYREALRALDQALALDPDYAFALGTKGTVLAELDRYEDALRTLAKASREETNYRYVAAVRGWILCDTAHYELALREIGDALEFGLKNSWIFSLKGWALEYLGADPSQQARMVYLQQAREAFETALRFESTDATLHASYGNVLALTGEKQAAEEAYLLAIEQADNTTRRQEAHNLASLAWCYFGVGRYDQAVDLLTTALSLNKGLISAQFDLALALMHTGRRSHALREYELALQWAGRKHPLRRRGLVNVALRDLEAALAARPRLNRKTHVQEVLGLLRKEWEVVRAVTREIQEIRELEDRWEPL